MTDLLLITDEAGKLLFHSRDTTIRQATQAAIATVAKENKRGLVSVGKRRAYVKEVSLQGRRHLFFLDFDRLCTRFGAAASRAAGGLFDVESFKGQTPREIPLKVLCRLFAEYYAEAMPNEKAYPVMHVPNKDCSVRVPLSAFTLCMTLLVRLAASKNGEVHVHFVCECGRVTVFADGDGSSLLSAGEREVLTMLLYEAGSAVGFAVESRDGKTMRTLSLSLSPFDISLLGLKTEQYAKYRNTMLYYISIFG